MINRIYLSPPHMGGDEYSFINLAFEKNWIAPLGENVDGFEKDLASYSGSGYAAAVTSGTAAIHLGLRLLGVGPGDEVICPTFTFVATVNPIRYLGASPVFVDSDPQTWNMDPELMEVAILDRIKKGTKPKAIIVVHLYGMPARMKEINEIAYRFGIPVLEDAAEALGSSINGWKCGAMGDLSVYSFNGNKIITTSGGGALLGDDEELIQKARFLATQARDSAPHYQHSELGYNYRMSNILAGIGRGQMKVLDERVKARRENHQYYFESLGSTWLKVKEGSNKPNFDSSSPTGIYFLRESDGYHSNRWLTTILVNSEETGGITGKDLSLMLERENIESRPLWKPMHQQPLYRSFEYYGKGVSDWLFENGLCLPSGSNLKREEKERIVNLIIEELKID